MTEIDEAEKVVELLVDVMKLGEWDSCAYNGDELVEGVILGSRAYVERMIAEMPDDTLWCIRTIPEGKP